MAYTITITSNSPQALAFVEYLKTLSFVEFTETHPKEKDPTKAKAKAGLAKPEPAVSSQKDETFRKKFLKASMKYKFHVLQNFSKEAKPLLKKYKSLKKDLIKLKEEIEANPLLGTSLGGGFKKIRLNITTKSKGKSGGARVITHEVVFNIDTDDETKSVIFVSIYDKSEIESKKTSDFKEIVEEFRNMEAQQSKEKTKK